MKHEYHEGPEALERFEKTMVTLFRAPKTVTTKKVSKKKPRKRRTTSKG
jgi:ribosomal protein S9